jgi:ribosomal protein S18 acetylase RimI-like enzyme
MERVLQRLRSEGNLHVTLNVLEANTRARVFYERLGFVPDRAASPWYGAAQVRYRKEL